MKLSFLLLFAGVFQLLATNVNGQNAVIHLSSGSLSVGQFLKEVEQQTNYLVIYSNREVDTQRKVNINTTSGSVAQYLDDVFVGTDVRHEFESDYIILSKKPLVNVSAQGIIIKGTVTDNNGSLPGVNVIVKGSTHGVVTDLNGKFTITVPDVDAVIVFSFIGYTTHEAIVGNQLEINIVLNEDTREIEEVVVVGYGTQKKINVVGAIATVNSDDLIKAPVASTTNALAGRLPGLVTKQNSGLPGSDASGLSIRGFGEPLVIVDGVEANFNNIDANEIESISVLKDASAAIYGARAGKGVILVTTKRGEGSKPVISFNAAYSLQGVTNMARQASSGQSAELVRETHLQSGKPEETSRFSQEQVDLFYAGTNPDYPNTDWWDVVARKFSPQQQYNLSIRGGTDRIKYYGFFGYLDQQSMFKNNGGDYKRYNIRSNIDAKILENLSLQVDISTIIEARRFPWRTDEKENSVWQDYWNTEPYYPATLPDSSKVSYGNGNGTGGIHIISNSDLSGYKNTDSQNLTGSLALNYDFNFLKGLRARAFLNYQQDYSFYKTFQYLIETWTYNYATDTYTSMGGSNSPTLQHQDNKGRIITGQLSLNYDRTFATDHHVSGLFLYELTNYSNDWILARRVGYTTTAIDYLFAGGVDNQFADGRASEMGRASYIGRVGYDFRSKYLFEATFRYDASAKFSEDERWGLFPSVSVGWRIAEEKFIRDHVPFLSNLKLRLSASQTGDDSVASFKYLSGYEYGRRYIYGGKSETGLISTGMANPWLTWESMNIYNAGLDFGLWQRALYGEFDVFYRERNGIPATRLASLPSTFGADPPVENLNSLNDRGFELMLGHSDRKGDFKWDINANISWSRSKWNHFEEPEYTDDDEIRLNKKSGKWTDMIYGYQSNGLFTSPEEINQLTFVYDQVGNDILKPGDVSYFDVNEDGILNWRDQEEIGKGTTPHWMTGMNINLNYKGIDLSAMFQGAFGFYHKLNLYTGNTFSETIYKERWSTTNNDRNAIIARLGGSSSNSWQSDFSYIPADYLRLKMLTIGYNLPRKWLEPLHIQNLRVYFAGTNLFTISKLNKYNVDPEAPSGYSVSYYPLMRTFTFGLSVSL